MVDSIVPSRCALRFKPPTLVLLYSDCKSGKQRRRSMPLRGIGSNTNVAEFSNNLLNHPRHSLYFKSIPIHQLHSLLQRVKCAGCKDKEVKEQSYTHPQTQWSLDQLTTCSIAEEEHGKLHGQTAVENQYTHQTTNEETDVNVSTHKLPPVTASVSTAVLQDLPPLPNSKYAGDKGKLSLDDLWPVIEQQGLVRHSTISDENVDSRGVSTHCSPKQTVIVPPKAPQYSSDLTSNDQMADGIATEESLSFKGVEVSSTVSDGDAMESESAGHNPQLSLAIPEIITGDNSEASGGREQDLNTVSEQALALTKEKMDSTFQMNCVQPGEEGWQYDKQHMFGPPCMESGWDSDSSSTQEF